MTQPPALALEDYSFWFKPSAQESDEPPILDSVSFEVEQGSFTLILGRSGSGKSTLSLNLVGIYPDFFGGSNKGRAMVFHPEKGFVNRRDLEDSERFKLVNMLFQNPEDQIVTLSVEEEIAFALENYQFPPDEIHRRIDRALDLVGIAGFRERSTLKLSGGEKQRVALASMLALEPRVLILDEPTSNLDPLGTEEVLAAVDRVRELSDLTLMVVEHEVDVVFERADSVLLVEEHKVKGPYDPRAFVDQHGLHVRDDLGLWIPQTVEVALQLRSAGIDLPTMPLTADELVDTVGDLTTDSPIPASTVPPSPNGEPEPTAPAGEPAIEVRGARFSYGEHEVLSGVDLVIRRNELLAVLGQNGSGKSTLASMLNGILQPTGGQVIVEGKATTDYKFSHLVKRVAYIFQVPEKQFIRNNVYEEMSHGLHALGLPDEEVERRTVEYLEQVRLLDRREASPYVLSHGQKRRLSVACMVVSRPDVVVLDEPTFGQDFHQAYNLMYLLRELADEGAAVVFITHDMRSVAEFADRCAVLSDGEMIFDGPPADLFGEEDVLERARLKAPAIRDISVKVLGEPLLLPDAVVSGVKEMIH